MSHGHVALASVKPHGYVGRAVDRFIWVFVLAYLGMERLKHSGGVNAWHTVKKLCWLGPCKSPQTLSGDNKDRI